MKNKWFMLALAVMMIVSFAACSDSGNKPIAGDSGSKLPAGHPDAAGQGGPVIAPVTSVVIPDNVKGQWASVKIALENKADGKTTEVTWKINSEVTIEGSDLKISVGDFLPDFRMEGSTISSATPEPNNPAIFVTITEGGAEIFKGWLYSKWPAIHPFQHEKFGITLIEGNHV